MDSIFERYERLPLGNICDANGKRGSMDQGIRPVDPELRMAGWAYTVRCHPGDNLAIHKAIQEAPAGSVLVVDAGGYTKGGHIGEIMCFACMQRGIRGIVLDGSCRDAGDIQNMGFPVFSRGFCPNGTVKETVGETAVPVICGGVLVQNGDLVVGGRDGVAVIAKKEIEAVLERAEAIAQKEVRVLEELKEGRTTAEIYQFTKIL
nr:RraA family protein [uncultured Oscillibacter sp.]